LPSAFSASNADVCIGGASPFKKTKVSGPMYSPTVNLDFSQLDKTFTSDYDVLAAAISMMIVTQ
jgi:hypothetical protein